MPYPLEMFKISMLCHKSFLSSKNSTFISAGSPQIKKGQKDTVCRRIVIRSLKKSDKAYKRTLLRIGAWEALTMKETYMK